MKEIEISIQDLFSLFIRKFKWIVIITSLFIVAATLITLFLITPKYTASVTMMANSYGERANASVQYSELQASRNLVDSYAVIIKSNTVLSAVSEMLDGEYSVTQLRNMISAKGIQNTQIITVDIETSDPQLSADIGNAIADVLPGKVADMKMGGMVAIIDSAEVPEDQSSPNLMINIIIAALLGAIVSYVFFLIAELLDTIVRDEEDLTETFSNIPILGTVPPLIEITGAAKGGTDK